MARTNSRTSSKSTNSSKATNSASSTKSNKSTRNEAKGALDKFKMEVASELGVNLTQGYNGNLTSKEAGSVGGEMVKKMIKRQEDQMMGN